MKLAISFPDAFEGLTVFFSSISGHNNFVAHPMARTFKMVVKEVAPVAMSRKIAQLLSLKVISSNLIMNGTELQ